VKTLAPKFDQIMIVPSGQPRLRIDKPQASGNDRLEMCVAALNDLPNDLQEKVVVNDLEIRRTGPTYAIETVNQLRAFNPRDTFTLIIGSDAAAKFDQWYRADALRKAVPILVVKRPGDAQSQFEEISIKALEISATHIREAFTQKKSVADFISPSVLTYIKEHKLYGSTTR